MCAAEKMPFCGQVTSWRPTDWLHWWMNTISQVGRYLLAPPHADRKSPNGRPEIDDDLDVDSLGFSLFFLPLSRLFFFFPEFQFKESPPRLISSSQF